MSAGRGMRSAERRQSSWGDVTAACIHAEWTRSLFPLTPALSLGEREKHRHFVARARTFPLSTRGAMLSPLPEGEGQGDGKPTGVNSLSCLAFGKELAHG